MIEEMHLRRVKVQLARVKHTNGDMIGDGD